MCRLTNNVGNNSACNDRFLEADYVVVGAGTAGMSFIDTLLTYDDTSTVLLVDRNQQAGGHWTTAYGFVKLHQPACNYGVNSLKLGGKQYRDASNNERFDIEDRSTGQEIVDYYAQVLEQFVNSGRVQVCFDSEYKEEQEGNDDGVYGTITNRSTGVVREVQCKKKVVRVHTNLLVPSMRDGPPFPVAPTVKVAVVNDIASMATNDSEQKHYVVVGAGKTGCDAITYLLRVRKVSPNNITWIVSRDVWFFMRDGYIREGNSYWQDIERILRPILDSSSLKEVFLKMEQDKIMARLDPINRPYPEVFKGATIDYAELEGLRSIENVIRMGRVSKETSNEIVLDKGSIPLPANADNTLIVDCMADFDGSFYGYSYDDKFKIFEPNRINLGPLITVFNPSHSSAVIAYMESMMEDDDIKRNSALYFSRIPHHLPTPVNLFNMFYCEMKTTEALGKAFPPFQNFNLNARTNSDSPQHHGGLLKALWGLFGPLRIEICFWKRLRTVPLEMFSMSMDTTEERCQRRIPSNQRRRK